MLGELELHTVKDRAGFLSGPSGRVFPAHCRVLLQRGGAWLSGTPPGQAQWSSPCCVHVILERKEETLPSQTTAIFAQRFHKYRHSEGFTLPLFVHTVPSCTGIMPLSCVITYSMLVMRNQRRRDGTHHMICVYIHMDAVRMCCVRFCPTTRQGRGQRYIFCCNYITVLPSKFADHITIVKCDEDMVSLSFFL